MFYSKTFGCSNCHYGVNFSGPLATATRPHPKPLYATNTFYKLEEFGKSVDGERGLADVTHRLRDAGSFRVPTLRNIAVTGSYMHDGSIATLDAVLDHYAAAAPNVHQSGATPPSIRPFVMTDDMKHDLLEFLNSLTDSQFVEQYAQNRK